MRNEPARLDHAVLSFQRACIMTVAVGLAACAPPVHAPPVGSSSAPIPASTFSAAPSDTSAPTVDTDAPHTDRFAGAKHAADIERRLFSPDGRYLLVDGLVMDLETKARMAVDCDLRFFDWFDGPRLACIVPTRAALLVLDLGNRQSRTIPCDASRVGEREFYGLARFASWPEEGNKMTLVDVESGMIYPLPRTARGIWDDGGKTVALLSEIDESGEYEGQLWDIAKNAPIGKPYHWDQGMHAISQDRRWVFAANRTDGQFVVDLKTGGRRTISAAKDIPIAAFTDFAPFSQDSTKVAALSSGSAARIVDVGTGTVLATLSASGCETVVNAKFGPGADTLVTGGSDWNVCLFDLKLRKLVWRADLRGQANFMLSDSPSPHVRALAFTADGEGIVAAGDSGSSMGWGVLLRASTGEILQSFAETKYMWHNEEGDLLTEGFLFGPKLSVKARPMGQGGVMCALHGSVGAPCLSGTDPQDPPWKGALVIGIEPKLKRVAGIVGDRLRVWDVNGVVVDEL